MFSCTLCAYTYNRQKYVLLLSVPTLATGKNMFSYSLCLHLQQAKMRSQALCAYTYIHLAKPFSHFLCLQKYLILLAVPTVHLQLSYNRHKNILLRSVLTLTTGIKTLSCSLCLHLHVTSKNIFSCL